MTGATPAVRRAVYSESGDQFSRPWRMVCEGRHKYVYFVDTDEELLFDLERDPHESRDLSSAPEVAPVLQGLRREMLRLFAAHPAPKAGRAGYSPGVPHRITREILEHFHPKG